MKKEVIVISLGGSLIIPNEVDIKVLQKLKKVILKNSKKYKFIIVCGGGSTARKYINGLRKAKVNETFQSYAGISATRMNARFMNYMFNQDATYGIPHTLKEVKKYLAKHNIVFCGALEYKPKQTSDSTSAEIAKEFKAKFINLTNIKGLYTDNPLTHKNAKFIPEISWEDFHKKALKMTFKPGQHFVLDQTASRIIKKNKIPTYIINGKAPKEIDKLLNNKKFKGTIIN